MICDEEHASCSVCWEDQDMCPAYFPLELTKVALTLLRLAHIFSWESPSIVSYRGVWQEGTSPEKFQLRTEMFLETFEIRKLVRIIPVIITEQMF